MSICVDSNLPQTLLQRTKLITKPTTIYLTSLLNHLYLTILALVLPIGLNGDGSSMEFSEILPKLGVFAFASYKLKPVMHNIYQGFTSLLFGKTPIENILKAIDAKTVANVEYPEQ